MAFTAGHSLPTESNNDHESKEFESNILRGLILTRPDKKNKLVNNALLSYNVFLVLLPADVHFCFKYW